MLAEFAGTAILILIGVGVVAQVVARETGDYNSIAFAWGFAVTLGVYTAARISGAHLNPAVTLALAVFDDFAWRKVLPYALAQTAGAFVAALLVRWNYSEAISALDPEHTFATQGIFSTLPAEGLGTWGAFRDQIIGTAILMFLILVLTHARNNPPLANLAPVLIGLVVVAIGFAWGANAGYAINPARDFGPRLASYLTGYETAFLDATGTQYWWVPILGPLLGGLVGGALFRVLLGWQLPIEPDVQEPGLVIHDPHTPSHHDRPSHHDGTSGKHTRTDHPTAAPVPVPAPPAGPAQERSPRDA